MRLATLRDSRDQERLGVAVGTSVFDVTDLPTVRASMERASTVKSACLMSRFLAAGPEARTFLSHELADMVDDDGRSDVPSFPLEEARLLAPVPWPNKLLLLAGNYAEHILEGRGEVPDRTTTPYVFAKPPTTTVIGPGDPIPLSPASRFVDYELELAVVIGTEVRHTDHARAAAAIAGYTVLNDVSERDFLPEPRTTSRSWDQFFDWLNGKWSDGFAPMGPWITTSDELPDVTDLRMELRVNGEVRQQATPAQMVYDPIELVAWISTVCTLEPGDVIATGTPPGIGKVRGTRLEDGDVVEAEIEGIGTLRNPVRAVG